MSCILYNNINKKLEYVNDNDILDGIYFYKYSVPQNDELTTNDIEISNFIKLHKNIIKYIKKYISKLKYKIPLYDIFNNNIFLIKNSDLYTSVVVDNFRFPDKEFFESLVNEKMQNINYNKNINEPKNKEFMIYFLKQFDLDILYKTYVEVFYENDLIGKNISICVRPSFIPHFNHIMPYYTRNEIIKIALNNNIIDNEENVNVMSICDQIVQNDISANILLEHHKYIIENNNIGLVQYYTLQGSYFMNLYLRNMVFHINLQMENVINSMTSLIKSAPKFNKSYILYRFVNSDIHLKNINIGEFYVEQGFTSTTRSPFYDPNVSNFGMILIKIKLPKEQQGTALCLETLSLFPKEQEIILAPHAIFRLDNIGNNVMYHHINEDFVKKIKTKYEFTFMGYKKLTFTQTINPYNLKNINFFKIEKYKNFSLQDKINLFVTNFLNQNYQFSVTINNTEFILNAEWYDSTSAYKHVYAVSQSKGFSIYCIYNNHILFFIEIGTSVNDYMHVNYFLKKTASPRTDIYSKIDFINFIVSIAYWFNIDKIILHTDYDISTAERGGLFCLDYYEYYKYDKKLSDILNASTHELQPNFAYYKLDELKKIKIDEFLTPNDDILYQLYNKTFSKLSNENGTLSDFYIWLIETNCYLLNIFNDKINKIFLTENPFTSDYYTLHTFTYLYNRNIIPGLELKTDVTPYIINRYRTNNNELL